MNEALRLPELAQVKYMVADCEASAAACGYARCYFRTVVETCVLWWDTA